MFTAEAHVVPLRAVRRLLARPSRPRRGPDRLVLDLVAVDRMLEPDRAPARRRLEAQLGRQLVRELDQALELDGRLLRRPRSQRTRRAA
jgi:hypothetical protein